MGYDEDTTFDEDRFDTQKYFCYMIRTDINIHQIAPSLELYWNRTGKLIIV